MRSLCVSFEERVSMHGDAIKRRTHAVIGRRYRSLAVCPLWVLNVWVLKQGRRAVGAVVVLACICC